MVDLHIVTYYNIVEYGTAGAASSMRSVGLPFQNLAVTLPLPQPPRLLHVVCWTFMRLVGAYCIGFR